MHLYKAIILLAAAAIGGCDSQPPETFADASDSADSSSSAFSVEVNFSGLGSISINDTRCDDSPCYAQVETGAKVVLLATPANSASFMGWNEQCDNDESPFICTTTVTAELTFDVDFAVAGELLKQTGIASLGHPSSFAVDPEENTYIGGLYQYQAPPGVPLGTTQNGFVASFTSEGALRWAKKVNPDIGEAEVTQIRIGDNNDVFAFGKIVHSEKGWFLARLNRATGEQYWMVEVEGPASTTSVGTDGKVAVLGLLPRNSTLDVGNVRFYQAEEQGAYLAIIGDDGVIRTVRRIGTSEDRVVYNGHDPLIARRDGWVLSINIGRNTPKLVTFRASGNIAEIRPALAAGDIVDAGDGGLFIAGYYSGSRPIIWGDSPELRLEDLASNEDGIFVGRWSADGTPIWLRGYGEGGSGSQLSIRGLRQSETGALFAFGVSEGSPAIEGNPLVAFGDRDAWVASFTENGEYRWSRSFGSAKADRALNIAPISNNRLRFMGSAPAPLTTDLGILLNPISHPDIIYTNGNTLPNSGVPFIFEMRQ